MSESLTEDFPGTERFTIVRRIGAGGMGVVYEAIDRERNARVAIKTLPRTDAMALYRFKQEFRALADVVHPNLAALYQLIALGDQWFFTMEYVPGCNFLDHIRPRETAVSLAQSEQASGVAESPPEETLDFTPSHGSPTVADVTCEEPTLAPALLPDQYDRLRGALRQLGEGICTLHAKGKLHRDIKPSNVLVTPEGRVVLLDFGLVLEMEERPYQLGTDHAIVGTVAYMSPEQAAGQPLTEASDWYCVGAMLYQVLTGQPPFVGPKMRIMMDKQKVEPKPPGALVPGIPEDLELLCRDLLRPRPADRPSGAEVLRRLGAGTPAASPMRPSEAARAPFVGRDRHIRELHDAFTGLKQRRPVTVHVHGRSGAGKSWLVQHFLQALIERENAVILAGRCFEQESVPYKALDNLVDALTRYLKRLTDVEAALLLPRDVLALARLFPVLRRVEAVAQAAVGSATIPDQQELRRRAFGALRELLARIGDRHALILHIDDLQWGDVDSAHLLAELLRPPDPPAILLLCSYRSEYAQTSACLRVLSDAHAAATLDTRRLEVSALEPEEARLLARALLGEDMADVHVHAEAIARESEGSPFFIHELSRHVGRDEARGRSEAGQPLTLDEALWQRIARLPEDARRLLETIAVSGRPLRQLDAFRAAGLGPDNPAPLTLLRVSHFVRGTGPDAHDEIETYHDRVRETVIAHLAPRVLRAHHENLAATLEPAGHADPETLAVHFQHAGNAARAGHYYARAAGEAADALAFDRAAKLYRQSLDLLPLEGAECRALCRKLADALANAGRGPEAAREYKSIADTTTGDEALELLGRAGYQFCASGLIDEGRAALCTVLERLGMSFPSTRKRALLSMLWHRFKLWLRGLRFQERKAAEVPPDLLARIDISWSVAVGLTMIDTIRGADFQTRNLLLALKAGEPYRVARSMSWEATHAAMGGEGAKKRSANLLAAADALAARLDNPHALGMATMGRGVAAYFHGAWKESREVCDRAADIFRERCTGVTWELDTSSAFAYWALWFLGELGEMSRRFPILVKEAHDRGDRLAEANYTTFGGPFVWLAADDPEGARQAQARVMGDWSKQDFHVQHFTTLTARAQIELYKGDAAAAWQHVTQQWPLMAGSALLHVECVRIFMIHLRARCALALAAQKDDPQLLKLAAKDARRLEREKPAWARCKPLMIRAALAHRAGETGKAAALLGEAAASADAADMKLYAAASRRRQGLLIGGVEGAALVEKADAFMMSQRVQNPARMADLMAPGFAR